MSDSEEKLSEKTNIEATQKGDIELDPNEDILDVHEIITFRTDPDDFPELTEEELEHEEELEDITCTLHLDIPRTPEHVSEYIISILKQLVATYPHLTMEDLERILVSRLQYDLAVALLVCNVETNTIRKILGAASNGQQVDGVSPEAFPQIEALNILFSTSIDELLQKPAEEEKEPEDEDGGDEDEQTQASNVLIKMTEEEVLHSKTKATTFTASATGKSKKADTADTRKKQRKRGTLTVDMDLDLDNAAQLMSRSAQVLNKSALKRVINEWSLDQFNKDPELLTIAFYLLAYFFHIPPFFDQVHENVSLSDDEIEAMGLRDFLQKTQAVNFQAPELDVNLKIFHSRFMESKGYAILRGDED